MYALSKLMEPLSVPVTFIEEHILTILNNIDIVHIGFQLKNTFDRKYLY